MIEAKNKKEQENKQEYVKIENQPPLPPSHQRQNAIQEEIKEKNEQFIEIHPTIAEAIVEENINPINEVQNNYPPLQNFTEQADTEQIQNNTEELRTSLIPSRPYIVVDEGEINKNEEIFNDRLSPKFENEDNSLSNRDEQFEELRINKMLVVNIENLESELKTTHKRINYLEEYNNQLIRSRNELYEEKEDLIKRSIEFEYIQQKLSEKEKRMTEIELENARRSKEILILRKDNENWRQQMESMTEFIK